MLYTTSIIVFPALTVVMRINVLRISKLVGRYGSDLFKTGNGPTAIELHRLKKYILFFLLAFLAFILLIFVMAYLKQSPLS